MKNFKYIFLSLFIGNAFYPVFANEEAVDLPKNNWGFEKIIGTFDRAALQRGFQVFKEVCATCHGLNHLSYRNLSALGYKEEEIKAIAAQYEVHDGPNDEGEMFDRKALPSDVFVNPYKNEKAARAANNGAYPPDLSLIVKARKGGADYVYAILTGYSKPPVDFKLQEGMNYNKYFPGHQIGMPKPLNEGQVHFADNTKSTVEQMSKDVVTFLAWAAEPELEHRKAMGIRVLIFVGILTILLYLLMKSIWRRVEI